MNSCILMVLDAKSVAYKPELIHFKVYIYDSHNTVPEKDRVCLVLIHLQTV